MTADPDRPTGGPDQPPAATGTGTGTGTDGDTEQARLLECGEVEVLGRLVQASNATLLVEVTLDGRSSRAVYKPVRGEKPLWDFPHGTLADREVATYRLCRAVGWDTVPMTVARRDGPYGRGSMQLWVDEVDDDPLVDVVAARDVTDDWLVVLQAESSSGDPLLLCHRDEPALRRMALLDAVTNNSDRKGGHVLRGRDGAVRGVDHGLTFNTDDKLRTVLWGWAGDPLAGQEADDLQRLVDLLAPRGELGAELRGLLRRDEVDRTRERAVELVAGGVMPAPTGGWPAIPWPAL